MHWHAHCSSTVTRRLNCHANQINSTQLSSSASPAAACFEAGEGGGAESSRLNPVHKDAVGGERARTLGTLASHSLLTTQHAVRCLTSSSLTRRTHRLHTLKDVPTHSRRDTHQAHHGAHGARRRGTPPPHTHTHNSSAHCTQSCREGHQATVSNTLGRKPLHLLAHCGAMSRRGRLNSPRAVREVLLVHCHPSQ